MNTHTNARAHTRTRRERDNTNPAIKKQVCRPLMFCVCGSSLLRIAPSLLRHYARQTSSNCPTCAPVEFLQNVLPLVPPLHS